MRVHEMVIQVVRSDNLNRVVFLGRRARFFGDYARIAPMVSLFGQAGMDTSRRSVRTGLDGAVFEHGNRGVDGLVAPPITRGGAGAAIIRRSVGPECCLVSTVLRPAFAGSRLGGHCVAVVRDPGDERRVPSGRQHRRLDPRALPRLGQFRRSSELRGLAPQLASFLITIIIPGNKAAGGSAHLMVEANRRGCAQAAPGSKLPGSDNCGPSLRRQLFEGLAKGLRGEQDDQQHADERPNREQRRGIAQSAHRPGEDADDDRRESPANLPECLHA